MRLVLANSIEYYVSDYECLMIRIMSKFRDEIREELGEIRDTIDKLGVDKGLGVDKELGVPELEKEEIMVETGKGKEKVPLFAPSSSSLNEPEVEN